MSVVMEQRAVDRFTVNANSVCAFSSPVLEDFGPFKLLNISLTGAGFICEEAVQAGLLLAVKLVNRAKKFERTFLLRVVHSSPRDGGSCLIGCEFETPLTYDELKMLVM